MFQRQAELAYSLARRVEAGLCRGLTLQDRVGSFGDLDLIARGGIPE